ncbi:protein ORF3 [Lizard adenovirus 2]|uniref:Protein ORF3 n=1 Tax=Lizard adenovirus 2 TaxID=874272 RepID=A0A076FYX4_9ADEN|nr:protein ORF3 [Lizard adenovirus 2]AII22591.1 protein ORF3 [Lizard adenovirus 2]
MAQTGREPLNYLYSEDVEISYRDGLWYMIIHQVRYWDPRLLLEAFCRAARDAEVKFFVPRTSDPGHSGPFLVVAREKANLTAFFELLPLVPQAL